MQANRRIVTLSRELTEAEQRRALDDARIASCSKIGSVFVRDNYPYKVTISEQNLDKDDVLRLTGLQALEDHRYVLIDVRVAE
jgi:hypothetical protein